MISTPHALICARAKRGLRPRTAIPCLALLPLLACSAAPEALPHERLGATTSALDPNQVFAPTRYTITLAQVDVIKAIEPYQAPNMVDYEQTTYPILNSPFRQTPGGGNCGETCSPETPCNNLYWTPDTGYVDWAQLGIRVQSGIAGNIAFNDGNPETTACSLGAVPTGSVLQNCQGGAFNNGVFNEGQPLSLNFSVNPTDQVTLALAVDNIASVTTGACASGTRCAGSGQPGGGVAVVARNANRLDVFYIGKDGGVWTSFWSGGAGSASWTTMEIAGGGLAPAGAHNTATARTSEALDVFFVDASGTLRKSSWTTGAAWGTVPVDGSTGLGQPGGLVSAVSRQPNNLDVVFAGTSGQLEWSTWSSPTAWTTAPVVNQQGGVLGAGAIGSGGLSIVAPTSFGLQVFYLNPSNQVETVSWADPNECNDLSQVACTSQGSQRQTPWVGPTYLQDPYGVSDLGYFEPCAGMTSGGGSSSGGSLGGGGGYGGGNPGKPCGGRVCLE